MKVGRETKGNGAEWRPSTASDYFPFSVEEERTQQVERRLGISLVSLVLPLRSAAWWFNLIRSVKRRRHKAPRHAIGRSIAIGASQLKKYYDLVYYHFLLLLLLLLLFFFFFFFFFFFSFASQHTLAISGLFTRLLSFTFIELFMTGLMAVGGRVGTGGWGRGEGERVN